MGGGWRISNAALCQVAASCSGSPGGKLLPPTASTFFEDNNIRLLTYDRPGYGGSDPMPGRRVVDAAADVAALVDHLGWNEFAVISMGQSVNFRRLAVRLLVEWVVEYVPSEAAAHDRDWWGLDERADVDDSGRPEG